MYLGASKSRAGADEKDCLGFQSPQQNSEPQMLPPQTPGLLNSPRELNPHWQCRQCQAVNDYPASFIDGYFCGSPLVCGQCGVSVPVWTVSLQQLKNPHLWDLFLPLGATTTIFQSKLFLDTDTILDLHQHGLPATAVILDVQYTGNGLFCAERAGGSRRQRPRGARLQFYGFKTYTMPNAPAEGTVNIAVTWVPSSDSDFAWNNLVSAFDAFADQDYVGVVIPANVAVENRLFYLMNEELGQTCSAEQRENFLTDAATYSHQLNVLLPYIATIRGFSRMDDQLRGNLNRLRTLRNQIGHQGRTKKPFTGEDCAVALASAVFGFRYVNLMVDWRRRNPLT